MLLFKAAHDTLFTVLRVTGFNSFVQKLPWYKVHAGSNYDHLLK